MFTWKWIIPIRIKTKPINHKRDGIFTELWENGKKRREVTYKNGKEDGLVSSWCSNGQKKDIQIYKNDNLIKLIGKWNEDGSIKE